MIPRSGGGGLEVNYRKADGVFAEHGREGEGMATSYLLTRSSSSVKRFWTRTRERSSIPPEPLRMKMKRSSSRVTSYPCQWGKAS